MEKISSLFTFTLTTKEIQLSFKRFIGDLSIDIPMESAGILFVIYYKSDLIQQEIAESVKKDKSAVLRHIDVLEQKGLLKRIAVANDRRRKVINITEKGRRFVEELNEKADEFFALLSNGLTISEVAALNAICLHLQTNARKV